MECLSCQKHYWGEIYMLLYKSKIFLSFNYGAAVSSQRPISRVYCWPDSRNHPAVEDFSGKGNLLVLCYSTRFYSIVIFQINYSHNTVTSLDFQTSESHNHSIKLAIPWLIRKVESTTYTQDNWLHGRSSSYVASTSHTTLSPWWLASQWLYYVHCVWIKKAPTHFS